MKKNINTITIVIALISVLFVGSITAMFTDADTATNKFIVGDVSVDIIEEHWDSEAATDIMPRQEFAKDPKVVNVGKNDAYVFLEVEVPYSQVTIPDHYGVIPQNPEWVELLHYDVNVVDWTEMIGDINGTIYPIINQQEGKATHLYAYGSDTKMTILEKGNNETGTLFDYIQLVNIVEDDDLEGTVLDVTIKAYAIQTLNINSGDNNIDGINDDGQVSPNDVWNVLSNQRVLI